MRKYQILITSMTLLVVVLVFSAYVSDHNGQNQEPLASNVNWLTFEEAVEKSKTEKKKIFVDVYTDWCGWCKVMDKKTFNDETIAAYLNEFYHPVKFNAEQKEDVQFGDHTFKFIPNGKRGYHELAVSLLQGRLSYPTVVFLDEDFNLIQPLPGFREAKDFHRILSFFGENQYKSLKWEEFQEVYTSPYN